MELATYPPSFRRPKLGDKIAYNATVNVSADLFRLFEKICHDHFRRGSLLSGPNTLGAGAEVRPLGASTLFRLLVIAREHLMIRTRICL
jgi:hypothetical protein